MADLFDYSVQLGMGSVVCKGQAMEEDEARDRAAQESLSLPLIIVVTPHGEDEILAAYQDGHEVPVERAQVVTAEGYGGLLDG